MLLIIYYKNLIYYFIIKIMLKNKNKNKSGKGKKRKYTQLEKIQLHINSSLGRPGPKVLPRLTDEEFLILQSKLLTLRNEQIGLSNKYQPQAGFFPTPSLLSESQLPQLPPNLPISMNPAITSGYELIQGNIIPAPIPDTLDRIGANSHTVGHQRRITNPTSEQRTPHSVQPTFGMGMHPRVEHSATPYKATSIFKDPEYIGPQIAITQKEANLRARRVNQKEAAAAAAPPLKKTGRSTGRGYEGDISDRDLKSKSRVDAAEAKFNTVRKNIENLKLNGLNGKKGDKYERKLQKLSDEIEVAKRNLQNAEEEYERRATVKGLNAGRFKTPNIDIEGEELAADAGGMTAAGYDTSSSQDLGMTSAGYNTSATQGLGMTSAGGGSSSSDLHVDDDEYNEMMSHVDSHVDYYSSSASDQDAALDRYTARLGGIVDDDNYYSSDSDHEQPQIAPQPPPPPAVPLPLPPVPEDEDTDEKPKSKRGGRRPGAGRKAGSKNKPKP